EMLSVSGEEATAHAPSTKKKAVIGADGKIGCDGIGRLAGSVRSGRLIREEEADIAVKSRKKPPPAPIAVGEGDRANATGGRSLYFGADLTDPRSQPRCHSSDRLGFSDRLSPAGRFTCSHDRLPWRKMVEY
ncbi:hypothetical protein ACLOJK_003766, partial [Asimina triloba]